ncbi:MAG TPA: XRE family transcriptional regulator [Flavobacteriales bacterium]|nr:XRE family transcriptional regulator [Methylococcaceae bacterium]HHZ97626.1 XRE family transcriptional regulator [Flavobacteriales bacterium]
MTTQASHGGKVVKAARKAREYTQETLAFQYGKSKATLQNWEAGRTTPSFDDVVGILCMLHFTVPEGLELERQNH